MSKIQAHPHLEYKPKADGSVRTIKRAAAILRCLSTTKTESGVTDISGQVHLHKSTVSRLLSALQCENLVEQNPSNGKYRLGVGLLNLASSAWYSNDMRQIAQPYLEQLNKLTGETTNLAIFNGNECINVCREISPQPIRYVGWIGRHTPLYCTATGKVILAHLAVETYETILPDTLKAFTEHTITNRLDLTKSLAQIRKQGFAVALQEFEEGLNTIAAPIYDHSGRVLAAISISGPAYRMGSNKITAYIPALKKAATEISNQLGYFSKSENR